MFDASRNSDLILEYTRIHSRVRDMDGIDSSAGGGSFNIAPLRPLEDFLTGKARFQER